VAPDALIPAQRIGVDEVSQVRIIFRDGKRGVVGRADLDRPFVLDLEPGNWQQLAVFHRDLNIDLFTGEEAAVGELPGVDKTTQRAAAPQPGHEHDDQHERDDGEQFRNLAQYSDEKDDDGEVQPPVIEQRAQRVAVPLNGLGVQLSALGAFEVKEPHACAPRQCSTGTGTVLTRSITTSSGRRPRRRVCGLIWMRWVRT